MKFIPYKVYTGAENMQTDNDLLESSIKNNIKEPVFRLYGWAPACVSLGRNQRCDFVDENLLKENNIDIIHINASTAGHCCMTMKLHTAIFVPLIFCKTVKMLPSHTKKSHKSL